MAVFAEKMRAIPTLAVLLLCMACIALAAGNRKLLKASGDMCGEGSLGNFEGTASAGS